MSSASRAMVSVSSESLPGSVKHFGSALALARLLGLLALSISLALSIMYSGQPILDMHSFRQTQTALTTFWFSRTGFKLAYETPVAGYPWSIPFEFPIYQLLAAKLSSSFGWDLERVGRLLSYAFLLLCLVPVGQIFKRLYQESWKPYFWVFTGLFLTSPEYLYWGRAFMIETAALFFALCFLNDSVRLLVARPAWRDVALSSLFLLLAMLQKATTVIPLLMMTAIAISMSLWMKRRTHKPNFLVIFQYFVALVLPFLAGYAWVLYTDWVKSHNALGVYLTSSALSTWNFGTFASRFSRELWIDAILRRSIIKEAGPLGFIGSCIGLIFLPRREKFLILLCVGAFALSFLIFENLNLVHDYYQTANVVFLILAASISIGGVIKMSGGRSKAAMVFLVLAIAANLVLFKRYYYPAETDRFDDKTSDVLAVARILRQETEQQRPILVYGNDWSSQIAFFSQRRSFTVPRFFSPYIGPLQQPSAYLGQQESAVVLCGLERSALKDGVGQYLKPRKLVKTQSCDVYLR